MGNLNEVTSIDYRNDYIYSVVFDDGMAGDVGLSHYIENGPIFSPLAELTYFCKANIEGGTIAWPHGADIAPATLYEEVERAGKRIEAQR